MEDEVHIVAPRDAALPSKRKALIFFITGNPGLAEYYRPFCTHLSALLHASKTSTEYEIYCGSLPGFEVSGSPSRYASSTGTSPFSLTETIDAVVGRLLSIVKAESQTLEGSGPLPVILMGHSVGSYILLEVLARFERMTAEKRQASRLDLVAGICLFPTVMELAKSPMGRRMTPVFSIPYFATAVQAIVRLAFFLIPTFVLSRIVQLVTWMPISSALTTTSLLKSRHGVQQGLYLAKCEMSEIATDKWSDTLWGIPQLQEAAVAASTATATTSPTSSPTDRRHSPTTSGPKLFFLWGHKDHWVANSTRDAIISARARTDQDGKDASSKPFMEIAPEGVPHAFCLRHSEVVAEKCVGYVRELERVLGWGNV